MQERAKINSYVQYECSVLVKTIGFTERMLMRDNLCKAICSAVSMFGGTNIMSYQNVPVGVGRYGTGR